MVEPWSSWNLQITNCTTAMSTLTNAVWNSWNIGTTAATTNNVFIWNNWITTSSSSIALHAEEPTEEERQRRRDRHVEAQRAADARARQQREASLRAERLLMEHLDEEQRKEMAESRRFHVRGSRGRRYCIHTNGSAAGNVQALDEDGNVVACLCAHPYGAIPVADAYLAQKLHIEHDEAGFLAVANFTQGRRELIPAAT